MFGILIGTACLIGLVAVLRRGARRRRFFGGFGPGRHGSWMTYRLFEALDTTPGQERVIRNVRDDFFSQVSDLKEGLHASRSDVARAVRSDSFDEGAMQDAFSRQEEGIAKIRKAASEALAKVHDVLDDKQRRRLAELLENGPGFAGMAGGPYRRWVGHGRAAC